MNRKRVLISGGAGFIGSHLSLALLNRGWQVSVLDSLSPKIHGDDSSLFESIKDKVVFIHGDVRNRQDWRHALDGQNCVVHLAAETGTGQSMYDIAQYSDVNIGGTSLLLDILANEPHTVRRMVVASSRAVYGEGRYRCHECGVVYPGARLAPHMLAGDFAVKCPHCTSNVDVLPTDEASRIQPSSIYGITKYTQEQLIMTAGNALNIPPVAFRYQNVYGPGQSLSNPYTGILSIFSTRVRGGKGIEVFEDGTESRDFVYIDDVVEATIAGIEHPNAPGHVFNVGSGVGTSVEEVAKALVSAYGSNVPVSINGKFRVGDIRHNIADLTKIRRVLGFYSTVSFHEGIERFTSWVAKQALHRDNYDQSIQEMKVRGLYR